MLWIYGLNVILLIEFRGELAVLPAVTGELLHHSVTYTGPDGNIVIAGKSVNGGSACNYCSTVT